MALGSLEAREHEYQGGGTLITIKKEASEPSPLIAPTTAGSVVAFEPQTIPVIIPPVAPEAIISSPEKVSPVRKKRAPLTTVPAAAEYEVLIGRVSREMPSSGLPNEHTQNSLDKNPLQA